MKLHTQLLLAYKGGFLRAKRQANGGTCTQADDDEAIKWATRYADSFGSSQEVASTKEEPKPHPIHMRGLKRRRARLLERLQEAQERDMGGAADSVIICDIQDELAAVESALGYPEPKEPEEANENEESGNQAVPLQDNVQCPQASGGLQATKVDSWTASSDGNAPKMGQEQELRKPKHCPTCLCLYNHEDPAQSCQCGK